ncbi:hypothetical protein KJ359_002782 [Pestalotiopsis sp. 9143b]|nr:hypothetical protein KJ359_002782 [Pestalotiopsis sp. 9143b]
METTRTKWTCTLEENSIIIRQRSLDEHPAELVIGFHRAVQIEDRESDITTIPPNQRQFPLFKIQDYVDKLPDAISGNGGVFFPAWSKEAMRIKFSANTPFMIKVYVGGINAISGKHYKESSTIKSRLLKLARRLNLAPKGDIIQDYIVTPPQPWLNGFATPSGEFKQFVALDSCERYSVEVPITEQDITSGGLQIEVTPLKFAPLNFTLTSPDGYYKYGCEDGSECHDGFKIRIKTVKGDLMEVHCYHPVPTVKGLKTVLYKAKGIPVEDQRLIHAGRQLGDALPLSEYNITKDCTIYLVRVKKGGRSGFEDLGLATQNVYPDTEDLSRWDRDATMSLRAYMLWVLDFSRFTGRIPPPEPLTALEHGLSQDFTAEALLQDSEIGNSKKSNDKGGADMSSDTSSDVFGSKHSPDVDDPHGLISPDGPLCGFGVSKTSSASSRTTS